MGAGWQAAAAGLAVLAGAGLVGGAAGPGVSPARRKSARNRCGPAFRPGLSWSRVAGSRDGPGGLLSIRRWPEVVKAIACPGRTEVGYSVPFYGGDLRPGTYFLTWLRPGRPGPATRGARSSSRAHGGTARRSTLRSPTGRGKTAGRPPPCALALGVIMRLGSPPATPWWIIGTARPPAAYLRLTLADSTTLKVPVTVVSGHKFFATRIGARIPPGGQERVQIGLFCAAFAIRLRNGRGAARGWRQTRNSASGKER